MRKIITGLTLLIALGVQAQLSVTKYDGTPIVDGQVISFNSTTYSVASLGFNIHNSSSAPINVKVRCESITNADGTGMEFCFGNDCFQSVSSGTSYPLGNSTVVTLPANGSSTNSQGYHFWNYNTGNGVNYPIEYVFKFYQRDASGNEVGNSITLTYRYGPNLLVDTFSTENLGISIKSTAIASALEIESPEVVAMTIYDLNGKSVLTQQILTGSNSISVATLSSSVYIIDFTNLDGKKYSTKFVKQ